VAGRIRSVEISSDLMGNRRHYGIFILQLLAFLGIIHRHVFFKKWAMDYFQKVNNLTGQNLEGSGLM
jgi:hypothetical protein